MRPFLLSALSILAFACAYSIPATERDLRHGAQAYLLGYENGLRVFVAPDPTSNLAEVDLRISAGARDEPAGQAGLAHLVEHAALALAPGGRRISAALAELALDWNAYTGPDFTHYRALVLADDVAPLLRLYSELLRGDCSTLLPEILAHEQAIVGNEIRLRQDTLLLDERESLTAAIYKPEHPYGHGLAGTPAGVAAIRRDDVCQFLATHYDPARATVVVTGAVAFDQAKALADATFRPLVTRAPPPRAAVPQLVGGVRKGRWSRPNPAVVLAFPIPTRFAHDSPAMALLEIAGSAALAAHVENDHRLTRGRVVRLGGDEAPTLAFIVEYSAATDPMAVRTGLWKVVNGIVDVAAHPFFEQLLRQRLRLATVERVEPLATRGLAYADYMLAPHDYGAFQGDLARIDSLERARIHAVAAKVFHGDTVVVLDLVPTPGSPTAPPDPAARTALPHDRGDDPSLRAPEELLARRGASTRIFNHTLSNGLRVIMAPSSLMPVIDVRLVIPAGNAHAPDDALFTAELAAYIATPRLNENNARAVTLAALAGADIDAVVDDRTTVFSVRSLSIYSDLALDVLRTKVTDSEILQSEIDRFRRVYSKRRATQPPAERAWARLVGDIFGGCTEIDTVDDAALNALDAREIARFRRRHYFPRGATLIVTGLFDPWFVYTQIEAAFAPWRSTREVPATSPQVDGPISVASGPHIVVEPVADLRQVYLRVGLAIPAGAGVDSVTIAFLRELLAAEVRVVRNRLGASYAPQVSVERTCGADMLVIAGDVEAARAGEVARVLADTLAALREGQDFPRKVARARQSVVRELVAEANDSRALGDRLQHLVASGAAMDKRRSLAERAAIVTPALIAGLLKATLDRSRVSVLCYGESGAAGRACQAFKPRTP
jgi:zinc protease